LTIPDDSNTQKPLSFAHFPEFPGLSELLTDLTSFLALTRVVDNDDIVHVEENDNSIGGKETEIFLNDRETKRREYPRGLSLPEAWRLPQTVQCSEELPAPHLPITRE
jgi:hypothetical protein